MNGTHEREQAVERLLRQSLQTPDESVTDLCLDAETIAAWMDKGLAGAQLEMAQSHLAECGRCRAIVGAVVRTDAIVPAAEPARRRWLAWVLPLAAAATAMALWVAVPRNPGAPVAAPPSQPPAAAAARKEAPPVPAEERSSSATKPVAPAAPPAREPAAAPVPPPAAAAAPPPVAFAARDAARSQSANALAESVTVAIEIVSPDPMVRWRIAGSSLQHSTNGGSSWEAAPTGVAAALSAGASPSTMVCWVAGRGGVVLLSTDGRSFSRVPFPEMTDLSSIRATDARSAAVTTVDGRIFSTTDGGMTWERR